MKRLGTFDFVLAGIATFGLVLPHPVAAATYGRAPIVRVQPNDPQAIESPAAPANRPLVSDIGLDEDGQLSGQVVDRQGAPLGQTSVMVRNRDKIVALTTTDEEGRFAVHNLRGGTYEVASAGGGGVYRVWTAEASPPSANDEVLIMSGDAMAPGQNPQPAGGPYPAGQDGNGQYGQYPNGQYGNGPCAGGQPYCRSYPLRRMWGCRCAPLTNGQVVLNGLYVIGFGGLITGIVIAAVNMHEQESSS